MPCSHLPPLAFLKTRYLLPNPILHHFNMTFLIPPPLPLPPDSLPRFPSQSLRAPLLPFLNKIPVTKKQTNKHVLSLRLPLLTAV